MPASQPNPVSQLSATAVSVNQINLVWTNTNLGFEAGALVERTISGQPGNFQPLATVAAGVASYADTSVLPGGTYSYRVIALPYSSRAFVPAPGVITSATTPGIPPHVYVQTPRIDPVGAQGFIGYKIVTDGPDGHPL